MADWIKQVQLTRATKTRTIVLANAADILKLLAEGHSMLAIHTAMRSVGLDVGGYLAFCKNVKQLRPGTVEQATPTGSPYAAVTVDSAVTATSQAVPNDDKPPGWDKFTHEQRLEYFRNKRKSRNQK